MIVTGGNGVIGRHLPDGLTVLSYRGLVSGRMALKDYSVCGETLLHLGGIVGEEKIVQNREFSEKVNVSGVAELAKEFFQQGGKIFYFASTGHVYGPTSIDGASEKAELNPQSVYAEQKAAAEKLVFSSVSESDQRAISLRIFSVLGTEMPPHSLFGAIDRGIRGHSKISNPDDVRDFLSPKQVASIITKLNNFSNQVDSGVINICTGVPTTVREASRRMAKVMGHRLEESSFDGSHSAIPVLTGVPTLLNSILGIRETSWDPTR